MSDNSTSRQDDTTGDGDTGITPGQVTFANTCGIAAAMLTGILIFYYCLIGTGHLPPPILGVVPIWTTAIIMLGAVKIAQWAASCAAERVLHVMDRRYTALLREGQRVADEALNKAQEAGQWQGIATAYRQDHTPGDASNVVNGSFGRRGGNAN